MSRCGCTDACTCAVNSGDHVTVTGIGSGDNPYIISADFPEVEACAAGSTTTDTTVTGSGDTGDPFIICADTEPSSDANNALEVGVDGKLYVPVGGVGGVNVGCGIQGNGSVGNPLKIKTPAWPYPCAPQDRGQPLGCDPATGLAYGPPVQVAGGVSFSPVADVLPPGTDADGYSTTTSFSTSNPDSCHPSMMMFVIRVDYALILDVNSVVSVFFNADRIAYIHSADHNASPYGIRYSHVYPPVIVAVGGSGAVNPVLSFAVAAGSADIASTQFSAIAYEWGLGV